MGFDNPFYFVTKYLNNLANILKIIFYILLICDKIKEE